MIAFALVAQLLFPPGEESPILVGPIRAPEWVQPGSGSRAPFINVRAAPYFAAGDGTTDDTSAIQSCLTALGAASGGVCYLPPGTYNTSATLTLSSNTVLGGAGKGATTISYSGAAVAVDLNDVTNAGVRDLAVSLTSAATIGVRLRASTTTSETRHVISGVRVTATGRTASQIGFQLATGSATGTLYHNHLIDVSTNQMDVGMDWTSSSAAQGPNGNTVTGFQATGYTSALRMGDGADNVVEGLSCLVSSVAASRCINIPGSALQGTQNNTFYFMSEQGGASSVTINIGSGAGQTLNNGNNSFYGGDNDAGGISDSSATNTNRFFLHFASTWLSNFRVTKGILGDGSSTGGFKHKRGTAGCATAATAGATCTTAVTWTSAFADTNYTVKCWGRGVTSGVPLEGGLTAVAAGSATFQTVAATAAAAQFTNIDCIAVHDY